MICIAPPGQICMEKGCSKKGTHPAPLSNNDIKQYVWLCISHIRKYNRNWNYYKGKPIQEVENDIRSKMDGGYPTWDFFSLGNSSRYKVKTNPQFYDDLFFANKSTNKSSSSSKTSNGNNTNKDEFVPSNNDEENAIKVLDLSAPISFEDINKRFKEIAKSCHPDKTSGQDAKKRELLQVTLQKASNAYSVLKNAINSKLKP